MAMPLVPSASEPSDVGNATELNALYKNFAIMTVCFSMNHATITTVVAFAGADFQYLGHYSNVSAWCSINYATNEEHNACRPF
jgi:hypothetical protein